MLSRLIRRQPLQQQREAGQCSSGGSAAGGNPSCPTELSKREIIVSVLRPLVLVDGLLAKRRHIVHTYDHAFMGADFVRVFVERGHASDESEAVDEDELDLALEPKRANDSRH